MSIQKKISPSKGEQITLDSWFSPANKKRAQEGEGSSQSPANKKNRKGFHIYVDLDGVLVDFDAGVERLCGAKPSELTTGKANLYSSINLEPPFYEKLPWKKDGKQLWNEIKPLQPDILTGHTTATEGPARKYAWCQRELGVKSLHHVKDKKCPAIELGATNVFTCYQEKDKYHQSGPGRYVFHFICRGNITLSLAHILPFA